MQVWSGLVRSVCDTGLKKFISQMKPAGQKVAILQHDHAPKHAFACMMLLAQMPNATDNQIWASNVF